jgi:hypothetical protein
MATSAYFTTSHPQFQTALVVLLRQLFWQGISCAIFMAAPDAVHIEVLRCAMQPLIPLHWRVPEALITLYAARELWISSKTAPWTSLGEVYTREEYETHTLIISPPVQEWLWFACSLGSWTASSFVIRTYPSVAAALIFAAWVLSDVYGLPFVGPLSRTSRLETLGGKDSLGKPCQVSLAKTESTVR